MRAYKVTHHEMTVAVAQALPGATWKAGTEAQGPDRIEGYVKLPASSPYRVARAGTLTRYPCVHGYKLIVGALAEAKAQTHDYFSVYPYGKSAVNKATGYIWSNIGQYMSSKGYACGPACPVAHPAMAEATPQTVAQVLATVPEVATRTMPAIDGPLLTDGEATNRSVLRTCRSLSAVCQTVYVLEEMYVAASEVSVPLAGADVRDLADHYRRIEWARRLVTYRRGFAARFARNLFDFMLLASWGEARESSSGFSSRYTFPDADPLSYDPRTLGPGLARCFECKLGYDGHSYGGFNWARIAHFAGKYYKLAVVDRLPIVFADHVVDLAHNGGLMTNKGFSFDRPSHGPFMAMLTAKRNGLLTQGTEPLTLTSECATLLAEAQTLGVMPRLTVKVGEKADFDLPTMKWGDKVFSFTLKPGAPTDEQVKAAYAAESAKAKAAQVVATPPTVPPQVTVAQVLAQMKAQEGLPPTVLAPAR